MARKKLSSRNHMRKKRHRKKQMASLSRRYKASIMREILSLSSRDIDNIAIHINPLKIGDKLFIDSSNLNDPRLMPNALDNEVHFEYGYLSTTMFLLNVIQLGKSYFHKDSYIYPALFCFRQYLENIMKEIIYKYDNNGLSNLGHDLDLCWERLLPYIKEKDDNVIAVGNILHELQSLDEHATAFRYPGELNKKYKQRADFCAKLIDVSELSNRILQVYSFFDGLYELACRTNKYKHM